MSKLQTHDRNLLTDLAQAGFSNPFGEIRDTLNQRIGANLGVDHFDVDMQAFVGPLNQRLRNLASLGFDRLDKMPFSSRFEFEMAILFTLFHTFLPELDQHIENQTNNGTHHLAAPVGRELLKQLIQWGFSQPSALRYVGIFFQLRRGFYFISRRLLGLSAPIVQLRKRLWQSLFTHDMHLYDRFFWDKMEDFSTLLLGETGTGKGSAAVAIGCSAFIPYDERTGKYVENFMKAFVSTNLSQYPASLIEAELFGYRKGAFTGALQSHPGLFQRCSPYGAVFLDELGDVGLDVQVKLLKVLEERVFFAVGSHESVAFRGRIIAATHRNLNEMRHQGLFRDDLYYRLSSDQIEIPSLRQRLADSSEELSFLVRFLISRVIQEPAPDTLVQFCMASIASQVPESYTWPGNVRELEQCVRQLILAKTYVTSPLAGPDQVPEAWIREQWSAKRIMHSVCRALYQHHSSYEKVGEILQWDRRTVKKYLDEDV